MTIIYKNGLIHTMDPAHPFATALAIRDGRILAVGDTEEITLQFGRADAQQIDLGGATVLPGLIDNHVHISNFGIKLSTLDFSEVTHSGEMLQKLREYAAQVPAGEWITGIGWNNNNFADRRIPTLAELNEAAPHNPVFLIRICNHAYLANSLGFARVGITRDTADLADGAYGRDANGDLDGMIYENASKPFYEGIPQKSYEEMKDTLRLGVNYALASGLTGAHTEDLRYLGGFANTWRMYQELIKGEDLRLRSNLLVYYEYLEELKAHGMTAGDGDEWVQVGAVKIFADGALGGRTALMSAPYADMPGTYGTAIHTQMELNAITAAARAHGMPVAVHSIGDGATDMVLEAMEQNILDTHRHRLIHAQILRPEQITRMQRLGDRLALDIQPRFVPSDFPWVQERVSPDTLPTCYAWKTLIDAGLLCGGGSDAPIEPLEPLLGLHAAVTRKRPGETHEGYLPEQKLTMHEAVHLFTFGSTYATREEDVKGTITPGKYADLTILDRDIFREHPDVLLETNVLRTVIGGKTVFEK
ncbi:MAG: amidohydrolase [Tumebacillaceae bacterium]